MSERDVVICDVGPRDGLQNQDVVLAPAVRAELCTRLAAAGLPRVEAVSFVSPRHVPAMADAEEVVNALDFGSDTTWTGLVLNERGFDRAIATGLRRVNYTLAATDAFSRRNQGCSQAEAEALVPRLVARAGAAGVGLTVTVAVAFGCPFEGRVPASHTLSLVERVALARPDELVLADTIGVAVPAAVTTVFRSARAAGIRLGGHFHDTRHTGIANSLAALDAGVVLLDASVGGTGGCPFAPGATGNIATEDLLFLLDETGVNTGCDIDALLACSAWLRHQLGRRLPGGVTNAGGFPQPVA